MSLNDLIRTVKSLPTVRARIKLARVALGLTHEELAFRAGVSASHLSRALNGYVTLTDDMRQRVADVLGLPVHVLFDAPIHEARTA